MSTPTSPRPLQRLSSLALLRRIAVSSVAQAPQVAAVFLEKVVGHVAEHRRGALLVARVAGVVEDADALLPCRVGELPGGRPAGAPRAVGCPCGDLAADPRAEQDRSAQQPEERRRRALRDVDAQLLGVRAPVALEERAGEGAPGRPGHAGEDALVRRERCAPAFVR
jgi:hypothetical protein